jgi:hypothetical protein
MSEHHEWECYSITDRDPIDELRALRASAFEVHCWAVLLNPADALSLLPVVHIEPAGRPDVADLPRVAASEKYRGRASAAWHFLMFGGDADGVMLVDVRAPVRCSFAIGVSTRKHRAVLEAIERTRRVAIASSCPGDQEAVPDLFAFHVMDNGPVQDALAYVWGAR